ncbi:zinc finger protein 777-like isoform X2 [Ambystoma mexicanum]|uniref:zinc finger protein 777-like isoform X2 n=1 Tax=Ambystoma mexicanum TaxID=8296 RepID=UPI0037E94DB7
MEMRVGLSQQDPDGAPVSFQEFASHFSKEEWSLLHEWQTQLYGNLMKEIHQALASLGPAIATSVFSLRPKEWSCPVPQVPQDTKIRDVRTHATNDACTNSDVVLRKKRKVNLELRNIPDINQSHSNAVFPFHNPEVLRKEQEFEPSLKIPHATETRNGCVGPSSDFPVLVKEEVTYSMEQHDPEKTECKRKVKGPAITSPAASFCRILEEANFMAQPESKREEPHNPLKEPADPSQIVRFIIKEDGRAHMMEGQDNEGSINTLSDDREAQRKRISREAVLQTRPQPRLGKVMTRVFAKELDSRRHLVSGSFQEAGEAMAIPPVSRLSTDAHSNSYPEAAVTDVFNQSETDPWKAKRGACLQNDRKERKHEKIMGQVGLLIQNPGSLSGFEDDNREGMMPYQHADYEDMYHREQSEPAVERALNAERPYSCDQCQKCFPNMWQLTRHQRTHSKERPFQCSECGKSYNRNDSLLRHRKLHTDLLLDTLECNPLPTHYNLQN